MKKKTEMKKEMICKNCRYWEKDNGIFCLNGWSGIDREDGFCHFGVERVYKHGKDFCSHFEEKEEQ